jgi:hypothetical protein
VFIVKIKQDMTPWWPHYPPSILRLEANNSSSFGSSTSLRPLLHLPDPSRITRAELLPPSPRLLILPLLASSSSCASSISHRRQWQQSHSQGSITMWTRPRAELLPPSPRLLIFPLLASSSSSASSISHRRQWQQSHSQGSITMWTRPQSPRLPLPCPKANSSN